MENSKKNVGLILAIVFASAVISGSLVFFAMQYMGNPGDMSANVLDEQLEEAIDKYVQKKQKEAEEEQAAAMAEEAKQASEAAKNVNPVSEGEAVYGNPEAKITLVEYSDFQCPYCKKFHETAKGLVDSYDGKVNWVYRHYPLAFHEPAATLQAMASECVNELGGSDKFWEFADLLYENGPADEDSLKTAVEGLGLSGPDFQTCLESEKYKDKIDSDMQNGIDSGVKGTPGTIVLNNETGETVLLSGAQPASSFESVIDEM